MRIAICDDDPAFLSCVAALIEARKETHPHLMVASFDNGDSLIRAHAANAFDVILLDVVMPLENGIDVAREIRALDRTVRIVFLTSSAEFAIDSYSVKASNYLLKPVDLAALFRCLDELEAELFATGRRIAIKAAHSIRSINPAAVEYLEAHGKHVDVVLADGETLASIEPLGALERKFLLEDGFFKCHRSYLVNINHIGTYTADGVTMRSGRHIPLSRTYRADFKDAYFSVLFGQEGRPW